MDNKDYINFEEAVGLLKTTRSTLYKWLQSGKVPGHKLGRQWRFRKDELLGVLGDQESDLQLQQSMAKLEQLLDQRAQDRKEVIMEAHDIGTLAEKLLWDAAQNDVTDIHIQPSKNSYQLNYRSNEGVDQITTMESDLFEAINSYWYQISSPSTRDTRRRFYLEKTDESQKKSLQIVSQQIETVQGTRLTLRLIHDWRMKLPLAKVIPNKKELETFAQWFERGHGIIIISGPRGSGKTTTVYSALQDLIDEKRVVFTLEESVNYIIEGANQVEVDFTDAKKVNESFESIYASDPDVIYFDLCGGSEANEQSRELAIKSAASGHLVVIQMEAPSPEDAITRLNLNHEEECLLIGASWQKLIPHPSGKGLIADFRTLAGQTEPK